MNQYLLVAGLLGELTAELQRLERWQAEHPGAEALASELPFCVDKNSIKLEDLQSEITGMKRTMGNALRNALVRAAETTGGEYSLRTGEMLTSPGEFWCVAIITRTI